MNVALQLKKIPFAKFPPPPPPQSMLITLSGTMVISCLVNIVQGGGGGGEFYQGLGCSKIRQKRSGVSLTLKPIVGATRTFTPQHSPEPSHLPRVTFHIRSAPNISWPCDVDWFLLSKALFLKLSLPSSKSTFSQPFKRETYE